MKRYVLYAILAAILYGISAPLSKVLLENIPPAMLASFLYLGAGIGILLLEITLLVMKKKPKEEALNKKDTLYVILMIILDIIAPILLMFGLDIGTPENISLINNFEIVATSLIAFILFKEALSKWMWVAVIFIFAASVMLSFDVKAMSFSFGSLLALLAALCWGLENNCTRKISKKDPAQIVILKGLFSGTGSLLIALIMKETFPEMQFILLAVLLGFVAYGLSIFFYVSAQRYLLSSKTSCYYALAPFIGMFLSFIIFKEMPSYLFFISLGVMLVGICLVNKDLLVNERNEGHESSSN